MADYVRVPARCLHRVPTNVPFEDAALTPAFEDAFSGSVGTVHFTRLRGRVTGFLITGGRVRNLRFTKAASAECRVQRTGC